MNKKRRARALWECDIATYADGAGYVLLMIWSVGAYIDMSASNQDPGYWPAVGFICAGLIRLRILLRSMRLDALIRDQEEEDRRLLAQAAPGAPRQTVEFTCPSCHVPVAIPTTYPHNVAKCPHCGAAIPLR